MLDDHKYIEQHDRSNGLAMVAGQAEQLRQQYEIEVPVVENITAIIIAGMGGSALAAEFIKTWLVDRLPVPMEIVRGYDLPAYANANTLIIASSYSGNTEEAISCFHQAADRKLPLMTMAAGGQLRELAAEHGLAHVQIPSGVQPRLGVLFEVRALSQVIEQLGLLSGIVDELEAEVDWLTHGAGQFVQSVPTHDNPAKRIAEQLVGFTPVIYAGPTLWYGAMKWKIDCNENGKNVAFWNQVSELNHNEMQGWYVGPPDRAQTMRVVELQSGLDNPRINKRFEVMNKLLSGKMPAPIIVNAVGETKLQQLLWTVMLGDFVSVYLALLNGIDPIPVELIEKFKHELG